MDFLGSFIGGNFKVPAQPDGELNIDSPADLSDRVISASYQLNHIEEAIDSARKAFPDWAKLSLQDRAKGIAKIADVFSENSDQMAELIARETGKPLWEAKGEAAALASKVKITVEHSIQYIEPKNFPDALPGVQGDVQFQPRGVMAVLGPFNFPAHLANGHIIPALLAGNTIVFKPSDKTPAVGQFYAQLMEKAGLPKGVFNLVHGAGDAGRRIAISEGIDGVLFTGSYDVGLRIKEDTLRHYWKLLALEMGGKNATVVWQDADFDKAVSQAVMSAYVTAGQRCSCTSRIFVHDALYDRFVEKFYASAKRIKVGHWSENPYMGPLISSEAVEKYIRFQEIGKREGCESLMRGKVLETERKGYYVTPSINIVDKYDPKSVYLKSEMFAPNVAIKKVSDFDETIDLVNSTGFGLVTSFFTKDRSLFDEATHRVRSGLMNFNRGTTGASSKLPFGGFKKSGNDRPAGDYSIQYCAVPVSRLIDETGFDAAGLPAGLDYEV